MRTSSKVLSALIVFTSSTALAAAPPAHKPAPPAAAPAPAPAAPPASAAPAAAPAATAPAATAPTDATTATPPPQPGTAPATTPPSPEAVAEAARQTDLARQALKAKRFTQAAQLFEAAAMLGHQASAHTSAALAWDQAERPDRAADAFARAIAAGETDPSAKERLGALERSLGTLDVKAAAGVTVQLDTGTEAAAPARLHSVAGIHSLAIAAPDHPIVRRDVRLEPGKPLALVLQDEPAQTTHTANGGDAQKPDANATPQTAPAPSAPAPTVERAQGGQLRRSVGFTLAGIGVASLGATIVLGVEAIDARNAFNAVPSRQLYDHEQTLQTCTNVALVGGALLVAGGVLLVLWPSSSSGNGEVTVGLAPTPGGGSLVGTF